MILNKRFTAYINYINTNQPYLFDIPSCKIKDMSESELLNVIKSHFAIAPLLENNVLGHQYLGEIDLLYHFNNSRYILIEAKNFSFQHYKHVSEKAFKQLTKYLRALMILRPNAKFISFLYDPYNAFSCHYCSKDIESQIIRDILVSLRPLVARKCIIPEIVTFDSSEGDSYDSNVRKTKESYFVEPALSTMDVALGIVRNRAQKFIYNGLGLCLPSIFASPELEPQSEDETLDLLRYLRLANKSTDAVPLPSCLTYCDEPLLVQHITPSDTKYLYYGGYFGKPNELEVRRNGAPKSIWALRDYIYLRCMEENITRRCLFEQFVRYVRHTSNINRRHAVRAYGKLGKKINDGSVICCLDA